MEKEAAKDTCTNGSETRGDSGFDRVVGDEGEEADEEAAEKVIYLLHFYFIEAFEDSVSSRSMFAVI